jgi:hypothetical protein
VKDNKKMEDYFKPIPYLKPLVEIPQKLSTIKEDDKEYNRQSEARGIYLVRKILSPDELASILPETTSSDKSSGNKDSFDNMVYQMTNTHNT